MANNKWEKPKTPPPPMFFGEKERNLVKQVNDEVIERVIGQQVLYFPIDMDHTNFHPLYGEAIEKTFLSPIRVYVREGDFVRYGETYYEILKWDLNKQLFGQIQHTFEITAECIRAREGLFDGS